MNKNQSLLLFTMLLILLGFLMIDDTPEWVAALVFIEFVAIGFMFVSEGSAP